MNKVLKYKLKNIRGMLITCPDILKHSGYDYIFKTDDHKSFFLVCNEKAHRMRNLLDTEIEVTGMVSKNTKGQNEFLVVTYKCVDNYLINDWRQVDELDQYDFDIKSFDYAI